MHLALNHLIMVRSAADQQFPFPKTLPHMQELDQGSNKATSPAKYIKKYMHIAAKQNAHSSAKIILHLETLYLMVSNYLI